MRAGYGRSALPTGALRVSEQRLLILDDDAQVGQTIQAIAIAEGFETRYTAVPEEFFDAVTRWNPTHVALDLVMPVMDGVEVMVQLALRQSSTRIIITSGMGGRVLDAASRSASEHGLDIVGVLPKPFSPSALRALLRDRRSAGPRIARLDNVRRPVIATASTNAAVITAKDLSAALDRHEIRVAYQPKIVCATGAVAGFEALARWTHPELGPIAPDHFIAVAEQGELIDELTSQVLLQGLEWMARLPRAGVTWHASATLSINLSARSLRNAQLVQTLVGHCEREQIDPSRLVFELTETSAMEDPITSLDVLTRMRMKGFKLSLDDFGTGYSSMLQLVRLPFSEIKIDRSFVMALSVSAEARSVVRSIIDLGHSLGLITAAEGVEDEHAIAYLREAGCDLAQGYYFARPMSGDDATRWASPEQHATP